MIRRDYIMRMVQEMAQVLTRVVLLKHRQEYDQALKEIAGALRGLREGVAAPEAEASLEEWIALCQKHEGAAAGMLIAVADLVKEQADLCALRQQAAESSRAAALSLGLFLEALVTGQTHVSADLLARVEELIERTRGAALAPELLRRLLVYHELRGQLAKAEDVLYDWIDTADPAANAEGLSFYARQMDKSDAELEQGGLPRAEVAEGRKELLHRTPSP